MKKSALFLIVFLIASLGDIASQGFDLNIRYYFKPFIMIALMSYYLVQTQTRSNTFLAALIFCWAGDVLLMFAGKMYFIFGLVAFIIGHVFYIFSFRQFSWTRGLQLLPTQKVRYAFPIILAATGLVVVLYPKLGALQIPVMVYALVIMLMAITALFRVGYTNSTSFTWVFIGAIFFMISDSALAINKFHTPFFGASTLIMLTYVSAQFMIVEGILKHPEQNF
jgi:uncharacterized membrane protein YhhN